MTNIYLDTEFDGHGGRLLSLALAAEDGKHWYACLRPATYACDLWVQQHVLPKLEAMPRTIPDESSPDVFRASLKEYLLSRSGATIWADWPDDFAHLMRLMSGPSYADSFMIPCTMQLIVTPDGEPKPEVPHNGLSDAIALMRWHQSLAS
jgi:hypothetical protein